MKRLSIFAFLFATAVAYASVVYGPAAAPPVTNIMGKPVSGTAPADGEVLSYVSSTGLWTPSAASGGLSAWYIDAAITGGTSSLNLVQASFAEVTDTDDALTITPSSGSAAVGAVCSSTNAAATPSTSATTCESAGAGGGNEGLGGAFAIDTPGIYEACMSFANMLGASAASQGASWKLVETATNAQTILIDNPAVKSLIHVIGASEVRLASTVTVCGTFNWRAKSANATVAVRLFYRADGSGSLNEVQQDAGIGESIRFMVKKVAD